jgi:hypothetical protein
MARPAEVLDRGGDPVGVPGADHHPGALGHQGLRRGEAEAAAAAGYDVDPVSES